MSTVVVVLTWNLDGTPPDRSGDYLVEMVGGGHSVATYVVGAPPTWSVSPVAIRAWARIPNTTGARS